LVTINSTSYFNVMQQPDQPLDGEQLEPPASQVRYPRLIDPHSTDQVRRRPAMDRAHELGSKLALEFGNRVRSSHDNTVAGQVSRRIIIRMRQWAIARVSRTNHGDPE
jgi:hypothetical protein